MADKLINIYIKLHSRRHAYLDIGGDVIEDGKIGKGEDQFMTKLLVEFDINIASVKANLKIQRMM